ncbi:MAG: hypothetical protein HY821_19655 [Acidobacteria bacterium]|nr:hypothetical protein [Acidobacteriota bacterium]
MAEFKADQAADMQFTQRDDRIDNLVAVAICPAFHAAALPWRQVPALLRRQPNDYREH